MAGVQATPISRLITPPGRRGVGWIAQLVPSHRSAWLWNAPEALMYAPAAVQADAEAQATVFRKPNCAPAGLGAGWICQLVPFHCSARLPALEAPTAEHADEDRHATPSRNPPPCGGSGVAWVLHVVPFHRSASVPASEPPTAVQAADDVHATPDRKADPAGLGVGWTRHLLPSHRSASALPGGPGVDPPTAVHAAGEVHDTPTKYPPPGLGAGWIRHLVPFHRSATARRAPDRLMVIPTASHADGDTQDTPFNALHAAPGGLGTGWMRHLLPFHRSASVTPAPELLTYVPTATHESAAGHDTQNSCPVGITGFGLGATDHPDPGAAAAGSGRSPGWPLSSDTFAPAGAGKPATASEATTMLARLARTMTRRPQAGL